MDYESIIKEKFPDCNVEVIETGLFETEKLVEYITDDILVYKPASVMVYRHMIRFLMNDGNGKIYYLKDFSDDEIKIVHGGLLKFTWKQDVKINLFKHSNPDRDVLGLE